MLPYIYIYLYLCVYMKGRTLLLWKGPSELRSYLKALRSLGNGGFRGLGLGFKVQGLGLRRFRV